MTIKSLPDMIDLVAANNKATDFSNELVLGVCWKESNFDDAATGHGTTAKGLMQITNPAVDVVNANTPQGVHFEYADMTNATRNIQCGTYYLQTLLKIHKSQKSALEHYGTGPGYADNLLSCEKCLKGAKSDADRQTCLDSIHTFIGV